MEIKYYKIRKLLILFFFSINFLYGFESIEVLNSNIKIHKSGYFKTEKDLSSKEVFDFVKKGINFISLPKDAYSFGISKDTFWFMFEISTSGNEKLFFDSRDIFINTSYDLFIFQNNELIRSSKNGFIIPNELRDVKTQKIRFKLLQNLTKIIYLIRAKSHHPLIPAFSFGKESELEATWIDMHNIMLISYFIGLAFLIYNFLLFTITKNKTFIYYTIYISGLTLISLFGRSYLPFNIEISHNVLVNLLMLSLCITTVGFTLFSIYFLGLKQKFPHLANIILKFGILLLILTPMYYYIDFIYIKILYMIVLFILSIFVFYAGYRVYLKGYEIGLYFMISTGIGSIFISFFMLLYFPNFLPTNIWSLTLVNQALIWDVITLSLALAYYIKLLQEENTKNERLAMIKSKEITIGELNGNIAHQWRTPLAELGAIQANIEARLQYSTISREELLEQIQLGKNVIQYLSQTIETFQSFFQSRATNEIFSINDEIKRTIAFIGESLKNNGIELEFIEKVEDTVIKGNSNEFSQIILNIILNAKDTLVGQEQEKKNIKVELYQNNSVYKIIISDNGGGIKMKPIESIFDCYTTNKDNGNGIGLFIVKMIVKEKFGGKINVHNNKFGAVFEIDLQKIF